MRKSDAAAAALVHRHRYEVSADRVAVRAPRDWRRWTIPALVGAATILLVVCCLTVWVRRQALDTPYVESAGRQMLEDQEIRSAVAAYLIDELYAHVDVEEELTRPLPARDRRFAVPFVAALRGLAPRAAEEILSEPFVVDAWASAVATAHRDLLRVVESDPNRAMDVYLGLRPLLIALAQRVGLGRQAAADLPAEAGAVPLFRGNRIGEIRQSISFLKWMSIYGLLLAAALYAVALGLARGRRREVLLHIGLAVAGAGVLVLLIRSLAGTFVVDSLVGSQPSLEPAGKHVWRILSEPLSSIGWMAILIGLVGATLASLAGPSAAAIRLRAVLRPALVDRPAIVWSAAGIAIVLMLATIPAIDATRVISRSVLVAVVVGGTVMVRRVAVAERG